MQGAWKVGVLILVTAGLIVAGYSLLGKSLFRKETDSYYAIFDDIRGVSPGAPVLLAGVPIGEVSKLELAGATTARVRLDINKGVGIPVGTVANVPGSLIGLGDTAIVLVAPKTSAQNLPAGSTLKGIRENPLAGLLPDTGPTLKELNATLTATRKLLEDQGLKARIEQLLASADSTAKQFGTLATSLDRVVTDNRGQLRHILTESTQILAKVQSITTEVANYAKSGDLPKKIDALMAELSDTIGAGRSLVNNLTEFVNDPNLRQPLAEILDNTKTMTQSGTRVAASAEVIAENGVTLSEKAIEIASKASRLADDAAELLDKFKGAIDKLPQQTGFKDVKVTADLFRESQPGRWRNDVMVELPIAGKDVYVGLYDAFESNKVNLQLGQKLTDSMQLRYGVYASKPGIGVDFGPTSKLGLTANAFGVNNPQFDLRLRYDFGAGIIGWVGFDRILRQNAPTVGIGIRR